tara:strand:- start:2189 stop:2848 length:660 start_codon:yes stop_codon:yes gene_type:complete
MSKIKWNQIYKNKKQHSIYPWSNLVSVVKNIHNNKNSNIKVIEIGCGLGANINFLLECGFDYYGIDYSAYAINSLKKKFPKLKNNLFVIDFTKEKFPKMIKFNLIIDRASGTHCSTKGFKNFLDLYEENFTSDVMYVAIDWFSKKCTDAKYGLKIDAFSKNNFKSGQFKDCGIVRFNDEKHIKQNLFKKWKCTFFRENISIFRSKKSYRICTYDFVMKK